jgi:hypothetical protein
MSDRMLLAYGVAFMSAAFVAFITWRVWYHAPEKVRLRRYRKDRAADILHADGRDI